MGRTTRRTDENRHVWSRREAEHGCSSVRRTLDVLAQRVEVSN